MSILPPHFDFFARLVKLDRSGALAVVEGYLGEHGDILDLYAGVLEPALIHAGSEWQAGRITVAHEHYLSEVVCDVVRQRGPRVEEAGRQWAPVVVACCAPRERHCIGLMMVADALRSGGIAVHLLGESLPAEAVVGLIAEADADLLCLSCTLDVHLPDAADLIALARRARPALTVAVGGAAVRGRGEDLPAYLGADWTAEDVREVRRVLPDWVRALSQSPTRSDQRGP